MTATSALPVESRAIARKRQGVFATAHAAKPLLVQSCHVMSSEPVKRHWFLPPTTVALEIAYYRSRHAGVQSVGLLPRLRTVERGPRVRDCTLSVRAVAFVESARTSDPFVRPVALYYASSHLL
jgi:hypothetical protein